MIRPYGAAVGSAATNNSALASSSVRTGFGAGVLAAVLFGISAPLANHIGGALDAQLVAGLLYLGAFAAIAPIARRRWRHAADAPLRRADARPLAGIVLLGGIVAPVLMLVGFRRTSGVSGSLLLDLEGPLTAVLGVVAFREHLSTRATWAAVLTFSGGALLTAAGGPLGTVSLSGALLIAAACAAWAIDNNLTQLLTVRDPFAIVGVKTGAAAAVNLAIALVRSSAMPSASTFAALVAVGAAGYGVSVVADAYALRMLGAAREATVFAVAPFVGAIVAFAVLGDALGGLDVAAGLLMIAGLVVLAGERHLHRHRHEPLEHDHVHTHDDGHHAHTHRDGELVEEGAAHTHAHVHREIEHAHTHVSDAHHRHTH